jgi:hypothetical protein
MAKVVPSIISSMDLIIVPERVLILITLIVDADMQSESNFYRKSQIILRSHVFPILELVFERNQYHQSKYNLLSIITYNSLH